MVKRILRFEVPVDDQLHPIPDARVVFGPRSNPFGPGPRRRCGRGVHIGRLACRAAARRGSPGAGRRTGDPVPESWTWLTSFADGTAPAAPVRGVELMAWALGRTPDVSHPAHRGGRRRAVVGRRRVTSFTLDRELVALGDPGNIRGRQASRSAPRPSRSPSTAASPVVDGPRPPGRRRCPGAAVRHRERRRASTLAPGSSHRPPAAPPRPGGHRPAGGPVGRQADRPGAPRRTRPGRSSRRSTPAGWSGGWSTRPVSRRSRARSRPHCSRCRCTAPSPASPSRPTRCRSTRPAARHRLGGPRRRRRGRRRPTSSAALVGDGAKAGSSATCFARREGHLTVNVVDVVTLSTSCRGWQICITNTGPASGARTIEVCNPATTRSPPR